MDILGTIAERIIQEQEKIIGPIALEQARKVQGLNVDMQKHEIRFVGNEKEILENLVGQYQHLFGRASVEVCREAVRGIISDAPKEKIPSLLF